MQVVGHGGYDGVHLAGGDQVGSVGVERDAVGVGGLLLLGKDVADGPEAQPGRSVVGQEDGVQTTLRAEPDDPEPNRIAPPQNLPCSMSSERSCCSAASLG